MLHFADLSDDDRAWAGAVVVTSPARTVVDCTDARVSPEIVRQAVDEGVHRGIFTEVMVEPAAEYLRSFEEEDEHDEHFALHAHRQGRRAVPRHGAQLMRVFGDITADAAETLRTLVSGQEGLEVQRRAPARSSVPHPQSLDLELALRSRLVAAGFEHHVRLQHPRTGDGFEYDFWQASDGIAIEVMGYRADEEIYKDILKFHVHQGTHVGVVPRPGHVVSRTCARLRGDGA